MDLCEWDAKSLLRAYSFPVPHARLFEREVDVPGEIPATGIIKAQTLFGGRGKAGLVRRAGNDPEATVAIIGNALAERGLPQVMMIEQASAFETELYISVVLDDLTGSPALMFSNRGGIDIEEVAETHPEHVSKTHFSSILPLTPRIAKEAVGATGVTGSDLNSSRRSSSI